MINQLFADDVCVNLKELAATMRVSRWSIHRWKEQGYRFEFGNRTTAGHLKTWLRIQAESEGSDIEQDRLVSELNRLR